MFADWKNDVAHVKKSFGALGKKYPKMLQAYGALGCLLYTSPSPRDMRRSRMPSSA